MSISTNFSPLYAQYIQQQGYPKLNTFLEKEEEEHLYIKNRFKIDPKLIPVDLDIFKKIMSILTAETATATCTDIAVQEEIYDQTQFGCGEAMEILMPLYVKMFGNTALENEQKKRVDELLLKLCPLSEEQINKITQTNESHAAQGYDEKTKTNFLNHFAICQDIRNFINDPQNKKQEVSLASRVVVVYRESLHTENASSSEKTIQAVAVLGEKVIANLKYLQIRSLVSALHNLPNYSKFIEQDPQGKVRGAGTAVVNFCIKRCMDEGYPGIYVHASLPAVPFYEKFEFTELSGDTAEKCVNKGAFQQKNLIRLVSTPIHLN